jgi:UDP-glucose 4-epimerase
MRVVITGALGFIGAHLVSWLHRNGQAVTGIDIAEPSNPWYGEIQDPRLADRFRGTDVVYHLAATSSVLGAESDPDLSFATNVSGTLRVLEAAQAAGVRRVVFTSSREVYGQAESLPVPESAELCPRNHYGATKAAAEMFCRASRNTEIVVLRLSNVYGPGDRGRVMTEFIDAALNGRPLTIFGSGKILDLLWIEDAVNALYRAAIYDVAGSVLNIGSGIPVHLTDLADQIVRLTGGCSLIQMAPAREMEVDSYLADISLAKRLLKFKPETTLTTGLKRMIASLSQNIEYRRVDIAAESVVDRARVAIRRLE